MGPYPRKCLENPPIQAIPRLYVPSPPGTQSVSDQGSLPLHQGTVLELKTVHR